MSVALETLYLLDQIVKTISSNGASLTKTKISRLLGRDPKELVSALEHGCEKKILIWSEGNWYNVKKDFIIAEDAFYPAAEAGLKRLWQDENFHDNEFFIENTSRKDSKIVGPWTRPDLTLISHKKYPWTIGREFDVVTFEIKRPDSCNVIAVFEALSHASAATKAYAVFPVDHATWRKDNPAQESRVMDECSKHGIGLILIEDVYVAPRAVHLIKAQKREIDHERCSDFLGAVMSEDAKSRLSEWK
ncbi:UNVERIFIED_ORG: hypothetical protein M2438_000430 [Methylobacterium sp. SuP10 SLI 274]|uniref:hypothetical protein n=1 Tax=Methylorubrum extorquens TaxID=408 RepID=UPI00209DD7F5|nr:hypothetical protein [Methylorubrum extorquens]MDF9861628.1 hypothetical protein [Methylorubrum pseudosasae]MDH6635255.1 hypothetical protein [Methylobacterium sp. SuP10 SLI 274]MDH6664425.1 hypothetical protein [Methylorubrum zatmanii]MCP1561426.1 hypothetical protein [Methylorubrum extorquens]MDF9789921.1 hypothetical protein [Methylorubrum extorquens]